jgi:hypothetical protein
MTRRPRRTQRLLLLAVSAMVLALSACQQSEPSPPSESSQPLVPPSKITQYVAMGDSFVSGPEIAPQQPAPNVCLQSKRNYPHLLAKELGIPELIDVSCAGASTYHLLHDVPVPGQKTVRAQEDALTDQTRLVTVGIGYNNDLLFTNLLAACIPTAKPKAGACQDYVNGSMRKLLKKERDDVLVALQEIRGDAPKATVVLVGYLPVLPEPDACPESVLPRADQRSIYDAERAVEGNLRAAASEAKIEFVSMRTVGRGHGMCAGADAWVNGMTARPGDGVVVHPRAVGMQAVADAVAKRLRTFEH